MVNRLSLPLCALATLVVASNLSAVYNITMSKIAPISGFPELLPAEQVAFNHALNIISSTYQSFGFIPLDTPAVERVDTLLAKGAEEKEIYGLRRIQAEDEGAKELALRFDLTVPLARYVAQHYGQLNFPFRRYHIGPVWRGERPQKGRYRQFYQADIDVIGDGTLDLYHDAELPAIIYQIFTKLELGKFTIRLNNRKVLQGFMAQQGVEGTENIAAAMRVIDDLEKMPREKVLAQLSTLMSADNADHTLNFFAQSHDNQAWLTELEKIAENDVFKQGVAELQAVVGALYTLGVPDDAFKVDPAIARGLGYYTGTIYETVLHDYPELGSVCSGGRYDNLAEKFTNKPLPGVGISIGISRLLLPLLEADKVPLHGATMAKVLVTVQEREALPAYFELATILREAGIATEMFLEPKKLPKQLKYADKKGFQYIIFANADELAAGNVQLKNLHTGEQQEIAKADLVESLK